MHLAFGTSGGPRRPIDILQLANGAEVRNAKGQHSRREYNASAGLKTVKEATDIIEFFESRKGALCGFRFKDPLDYSSGIPVSEMDQILGEGDGVRTDFNLVKIYGEAPYSYSRPISKPVDGTVIVAVDGIKTAVLVDYTTGQIRFDNAPKIDAIITAGFEFDVPVRFASDSLDISLDDFEVAQVQDIPLIEILYPSEVPHG